MHTMESLFEQVNTPLKIKELIPVNQENLKRINVITNSGYSMEQINKVFNEAELETKYLFFSTKGFYPYWYIKGFCFVGIMAFDSSILKFLVKDVKKYEELLQQLWDNKDCSRFFTIVNESFAFDVFLNHFNEIPEADVYQVFKSLYVKHEYGFQDIDKDIIRKIFALNKDKSFLKKLNASKDGLVTIYRGECSKSSDYKEAYSWTLNYDTAVYFATRFNSLESKIYQAKIHVNDIVDLIEDRGEQEILALPETVLEVTDLNLYNFNESFMEELQYNRAIDYIKYYKSCAKNHIKEYLFRNARGVHGVLHTKRVLLLSSIISFLEELDQIDMNILCLSACYHDIGRVNDDKDDAHGKRSVIKIEDFGIFKNIGKQFGLDKQDIFIVKAIIRNHAIDDKAGMADILSDSSIADKNRATKLYKLFKDADNLDRVRLGNDLDTKYLRGEFSKRLVLVAHQLLRNIQ